MACTSLGVTTFNVLANLANTTSSSQSASVYVAVYNKTDERLQSIKKLDISVGSLGNYGLNQTMNGNLSDCIVKIFVWGNNTNEPLSLIGKY